MAYKNQKKNATHNAEIRKVSRKKKKAKKSKLQDRFRILSREQKMAQLEKLLGL